LRRRRAPRRITCCRASSTPPATRSSRPRPGLVSKVEKKILDFSDAWEEAIRLSFKATDDRAADATDLETIWADPEKKSEAEKVDAAQKLLALDVPHEIAWERAGLSPKEIEKAKKALPEILRQKALLGPQPPLQTDPTLPQNQENT
jgi:hypothetical protein